MAGKRDREKLRTRVKTELRKAERTQKDLEGKAGLSSGTLTRVFGGRRQLDRETVEAVASELGMTAAELVEGTAFDELLADVAEPAGEPEAEPTPEPAAKSKPTWRLTCI